jgi:hypothetical protein
MDELENCVDHLSQLAETGSIPFDKLAPRAREAIEHYWPQLDGGQRQELQRWLSDREAERRQALGEGHLERDRRVEVAEAALREIYRLLQAERKA